MDIKKYRVVCTRPEMSDDIYIDIAPDSGVIHDQIFSSRQQLHQQSGGQQRLEKLYGSIYLEDNNGEISIDFPPIEAEKGTAAYQKQLEEYELLEPKIVRRYKKMRAAGRDTTLFIHDIGSMLLNLDSKEEKSDFPMVPKNLQEERIAQQKAEFTAIRERRLMSERKRASLVVPAWRRFQKEYSGD